LQCLLHYGFLFSRAVNGSGTLAQDGASSEATQSLKARDAVVSSEDPATNSTASAELELQPGLDQSSDLISIGEYIDPDRGGRLKPAD
jgi:hypothetical protein